MTLPRSQRLRTPPLLRPSPAARRAWIARPEGERRLTSNQVVEKPSFFCELLRSSSGDRFKCEYGAAVHFKGKNARVANSTHFPFAPQS
jgi:hypothetical protein